METRKKKINEIGAKKSKRGGDQCANAVYLADAAETDGGAVES